MLQIRADQLSCRTAEIVEAKLAHLFPAEKVVLRSGFFSVVEVGIHRAAANGFTQPREIGRYVALLPMLGTYFDEDPLLPWAQTTLKSHVAASQEIRMDRLFCAAMDYVERIAGEDGRFARNAMTSASQIEFSEVVGTDAATLAQRVYPQRHEELGAAGHRARMDAAVTIAVELDPEDDPEQTTKVVALIMLFAGSQFIRDPLHPWARRKDVAPSDCGVAFHLLRSAQAHLARYQAVRSAGDA